MTRVPKYRGIYFRESAAKRFRGYPDKCFYFTYRIPGGRLIWEKAGWTSEGYNAVATRNIRADRLRRIRHGDVLPGEKKDPTLGEVWIEYDKWQTTAKRQQKDNRSRYQRHLRPRFENTPLSGISSLDLENMKDELIKEGFAPATVKHCLVLVRQMINKAIAWDLYAGENPIKKVTMPKVHNRRERFLTVEESSILLNEVQKVSPQLHDICLLSLHTGMRAGEILNLKWIHIDIENGLIHVADSRSGRARKAYMTETVKALFRRRGPGKPEEFVFTKLDGERMNDISNPFTKVVKGMGFNEGIEDPRQRVCFHTLRHTFASWLALQGTPILTIKELLGHQTLAMTERYSHLLPDHKRQAILGIERAARGEPLVLSKS